MLITLEFLKSKIIIIIKEVLNGRRQFESSVDTWGLKAHERRPLREDT